MASRNSGIKIDTEKFERMLKTRGLSKSELSLEMGYSRTLLTDHIRGGYTTMYVVNYLEKIYNIPRESYIIPEPKPEPVQEQTSSETDLQDQMIFRLPADLITKDELHEIIRSAVYDAVSEAWREK